MNTSFQLRSSKKDQRQILFTIRVGDGSKQRLTLPIKIHKDNWSPSNGYPKRKRETLQIRNFMEEVRGGMEEWFNDFYSENKRIPSKEEVRNKFNKLVGKEEPKKKEKTLVEYFDEYLSECRKERKDKKTIQKYKACRDHFAEFTPNAEVQELTRELGDRFYHFLLEQKQQQNRTINKNITILRGMINWLERKGVAEEGQAKKLQLRKEVDQTIVVLTEEELRVVEEAELEDTSFQQVRALFLLQTYLGLRYSDMLRLYPKNFHNQYLSMVTEKDHERLELPLPSKALPILERYEYDPPKLSAQLMNRKLKELFRHLELDRLVQKIRNYGQSVEVEEQPLHDVVGTHVARRTFISHKLAAGLSSELVRSLSGHRDIENFSKYVNFSEDQKKWAMEH